ncbi:apolipoprotein D [Trichonephila inaurata madagascariensis]|uniref:Apolipoprotein D n=1 Tax=Trichonephila inaurata madagascariensis TaxID=2747483 RepID=A0A8X6XU44_9ARAC|nr:apolipoprotein D [Trichonephila inaurata madagascariensis]
MRVHRNCYFVCWAAVFLAYLICHVHSQTLLLGACPNPPMQSEFSAQDFLGRWYEVERTFVMAEVGWRCITVDYREESGRVRVETSGNAVVKRTMAAVATFTPSTPARIILRGEGSLPTQSTNYVLLSDYNNFAVVWSCRNVDPLIPITGLDFLRNLSHTENLWILSRNRTMDATTKEKIYSFLDTNAINRRSLRPVPQENCQEGTR